MELQGAWDAASLAGHWRRLARTLGEAGADAAWDFESVTRFDHLGAQLLWDRWGRDWPRDVALTDAQRSILERLEKLGGEAPKPQRERAGAWCAHRIDRLGVLVLHAVDHGRALVALIGQLALDIGRFARAPREAPWRDISGHLYSMGATALPITAMVGALIGVVLAYLMSMQLRQFGAESFIVNILGISLIRELGPLLGAILVAGRSGSAITAQIGVMRVTDELDAMSVMGISHGFRLVMPRAIALAIAMPLVSVWTTLCALVGGMAAADIAMNITPAYFFQALPNAVQISNLWLALGKSAVFGVLIALIGCHWGLRVEPNTQSLGQGTTASVVTSITVVILVDALFAVAFKSIGI
ncbi:MlaE family ABC transporter permease [Xylophilus sp.]|uniref:MlaE family ABC transporter permease n=1 Tax=Xylophilus sp. TaxID=2653893 RepID=UPI0013BB6F04|nr:ABC transporter permease [Xylophilus sp.]KAF1046305.1 MAG: putative phospholipid ABC transporter permease protein MlaE [Xylophilus sp.]